MNKKIVSVICTVFLMVLAISGNVHASAGKGAGGDITGSWKPKDASAGIGKITFHEDGTFEMDVQDKGRTDLWGVYSILGKNLTLTNKRGRVHPSCYGLGMYEYAVSGKELKYNPISDRCVPRVKSFKSVWQKVS